MSLKWSGFLISFLMMFQAFSSHALPLIESRDASHDRTELSLYFYPQIIAGDSNSYCYVLLTAQENILNGLSEGEEFTISVTNDSKQLLYVEDAITQSESEAGYLSRGYDCNGRFDIEVSGGFPLQASFWVEDNLHLDDEDQTEVYILDKVIDDDAEIDNFIHQATPLNDEIQTRIVRDMDWFSFELTEISLVEVHVFHYPREGGIIVEATDDLENSLDSMMSSGFVNILSLGPISEGDYFVKVEPEITGDHNFYDIWMEIEATNTSCVPEEAGSRACGRCGTQERICGSLGEWLEWGDCNDQGECQPGDAQTVFCEDGFSVRYELCTSSCVWAAQNECITIQIGDAGPPLPDDSGVIIEENDAGNPQTHWDAGATVPFYDGSLPVGGRTQIPFAPADPDDNTAVGCTCASTEFHTTFLWVVMIGVLEVFRRRRAR